jgi:hypothetical protein
MDHAPGNQERDRVLRDAIIGYLHEVQSPAQEPAVERQEKAITTTAPGRGQPTGRTAASPLPRRSRPRPTPTTPQDEAPDVTIDLRDGERIGGIWQRPADETPAPLPDPPMIPGSDRYAFSLAVGNSYCYVCGRFAMHQIVLEATPPTRARRLGAYRCRCTLCEYMSSPRPSEIHRAEEHLAATGKRGAWSRARRAVSAGRGT